MPPLQPTFRGVVRASWFSLLGCWTVLSLVCFAGLQLAIDHRLSKDLVAYWSGAGAGESRGRFWGEFMGGVQSAPGINGQGYDFDGVTGHIHAPHAEVLNAVPLTIAVWIKPALRAGEPRLRPHVVADVNSDRDGHGIGAEVFSSGSALIIGRNGGNLVFTNAVMTPDTWHHIAVAYSAAKTRAYLDGRLIGEFEGINARREGWGRLVIGAHDKGLEQVTHFKGTVDELRVYHRVLSRIELAALAQPDSIALCIILSTATAGILIGGILLRYVANHQRPDGGWRPTLAASTVGLGGVAATVLFAMELSRASERYDQRQFESLVDLHTQLFDRQLEVLVQHLNAVRGWISGQSPEDVSPSVWIDYIESLDVPLHFPGIFEIGYLEKVDPHEVSEFLTRMMRWLGNDFRVFSPWPEAHRPYFAPVTLHAYARSPSEPRKHFQHYGADFMCDVIRYGAMHWGIVSKNPGATHKVSFVPDAPEPFGFQVFLPVFDWNPDAQGERGNLRTVRGWVFGSIDVDAMLRPAVQTKRFEIGIVVRESQNGGPKDVLFGDLQNLELRPDGSKPLFARHVLFRLYGQKLHLDFYSLPEFEARSLHYWPKIALGVGGTISVLLAGFVFVQTQRRVKERAFTRQLIQSEALLKRTEQGLRQNEHHLQVALQERERLSRDLHDIVIQSIYAVGLSLQSCRKLMARDAEKASERLTENMAELNAVVGQLRRFILSLGPELIQGDALEDSLESLVRTMERIDGPALSVELDPHAAARLTPGQSVHVLNIAREAISNCLRHAQARRIIVRLRELSFVTRLEIEDDGRGFNLEATARDGGGHGLRNLQSRTRELGAELHIATLAGKGTRVRVDLPVCAPG